MSKIKCSCGGLGCKLCARQQPTKAWHQNSKANKVEFDGHIFDSTEEMEFYRDWLLTGKYRANIDIIELQPKYELLPKFEKMGKRYQAMTYKPDFYIEFTDNEGNRYAEVIDVKGYIPRYFTLTRKLFDYFYPDLELIIIKKMPIKFGGGFGTWEQYQAMKRAENKAKGAAGNGQAKGKTKRKKKTK